MAIGDNLLVELCWYPPPSSFHQELRVH